MSDLPEKDNNLNENTENISNEEDGASTVFSDPADHKKTASRKKRPLLPIIISAVLAVAVLAGGTVAVIKLIPEREDDTSTPSVETIKVLDKSSDDFKTVTVTNKSGTFKLYSEEEKDESSSSSSDTSSSSTKTVWYLDGYAKDVINSSSVSSIVSSVASVTASREVTAKSAAECGLEKPTVKADVVTKDGEEFSLLIGGDSPDGTGIYIKLSTDDKIYINDSSIDSSLEFNALSLAATDSIAGVPTSNLSSDYKDDNGDLSSFDSITLAGSNFPEKLVIAPNTDKNLSTYAAYMTTSPTKRIADNVDGIFGLFKSGVTVSGAYSFDTSAASRKKLGLDNPELTAEIKVGSVKQSYSFKKQEDGGYAVWYDGAKLIKKVDASSITFIDYKVNNYYASWVCLQSINELSNFTIKTPEKTYSFDIVYDDAEDAEETYVITYEGKKLTAENFQSFYQECISLSCSDFTVDKVSGEPAMTIVFTYSDTSRAKTDVKFVKSGAAKYQYSIDGIEMGKINSSALNKILKHVEKVAKDESIK